MGSLSSLAYWINTAKKLAAPVEGRVTHNQWIRNPENAAKLGVTVEEAAKAHPDLVTIRQLGHNTDINPMADGAMTDQQLRLITEMIQGMQDLNPSTAVRVGDSVGNLYKSPSMMEFLGAERVKDLPQGWKDGGVARLGKGGNDFRTPKHLGMSHTFSSAGEPYVNKYGTEMVPEKGANGKYYLRESAGVEAPLLDPMDPWMIPKTAPLSVVKKLAQMAKAVPESIAHGAQEFARASAPAYVKEEPLRRLMFRGRSDAGVQDNPSLFLAADKDHATYYANRRAAEVGGEPVVDSYLVNPFDGTDYGHGAPSDRFNDFQILVSRAKQLPLEDASLVRTDKVSPDLVRKADGGSVDRSPRIYTPTDGPPTTTGTRGLTRGLHDILQAMKEYHANA